MADAVSPRKEQDAELPVPTIWRPTFEAIVTAMRSEDWSLSTLPVHVVRLSSDDASFIRSSIDDYGSVTLRPLPVESWDSSIAAWDGEKWVVLVDLWTVEEGRSDLVLHAFVREVAGGYEFEVYHVYVP